MGDVLAAFNGAKKADDGWTAKCPAHEDRRASLSIGQGDDGRWLLYCHAGCDVDAILAAAHLETSDLFPKTNNIRRQRSAIVATYDYTNEQGGLLYQVVRFDPKDFRQRRPDGHGGYDWSVAGVRRVLYRLATLQGQITVYIVEGEKDVATLVALGLPATTNAGGASKRKKKSKWRDDYTEQLTTAGVEQVVVVPDNDEAGQRHAEAVAASCHAAGIKVKLVALPVSPNGDVSDYLADLTKDDLFALVKQTLRFTATDGPAVAPLIQPRTLDETIAVFQRWLYLEDPSPLYVVAATLVANRAPGDPVWLLLVCAPSTGKTEILSATSGLSWVIPAAKMTEASLLSGTSARERTKGATGGLLRQVGDFGVLLCKDFSSVLAQNKDARAEAMAALREVYDGDWHRPVGTDGGKVLTWVGKCGLIGGVTPALDQYGQVISALGDRFLLLRLPDVDVDAFGAASLRHGDQEQQMRQELRDAMAGLVEHADTGQVNRVLDEDEQRRLIHLAAYTARARTAVVRDGYRQDVLYLPQVEGPGRLVKAYARLLGGLEAIGCDAVTTWDTITRIAIDCAPALRTRVIRELTKHNAPVRTSHIATACEVVTRTASRYLEDLSILRLATRTKMSAADNSPDLWEASTWLREYWPESRTDKYPPAHKTPSTEAGTGEEPIPPGTSQSHFPSSGEEEGDDADLCSF